MPAAIRSEIVSHHVTYRRWLVVADRQIQLIAGHARRHAPPHRPPPAATPRLRVRVHLRVRVRLRAPFFRKKIHELSAAFQRQFQPETLHAGCLVRTSWVPQRTPPSSTRSPPQARGASAPLGHGGRLPAPPPKCRRRAAERITPCLGAGASARRPPLLPLAAKRKKATHHRRFCAEACALSRRSFVNNEQPEVLLCERSASESRARREGRSQQMA